MRKMFFAVSMSASLLTSAVIAQETDEFVQGTAAQRLLSGIGIIDPKKPDIDYRARPNLVIPPSVDALPAPAQNSKEQANWPKDEETIEKKRVQALKKMPFGEREKAMGIPEGGHTRLSIDELRAGRVEGAGIVRTPDQSQNTQSPLISPEELRKTGVALQKPALGVEPERKWLTDPPSGYRVGNPNAGYAESPSEKKSFFSRLNPFN